MNAMKEPAVKSLRWARCMAKKMMTASANAMRNWVTAVLAALVAVCLTLVRASSLAVAAKRPAS
ncbi:hypothetical protein D3C84_1197730 [compost metagenome]